MYPRPNPEKVGEVFEVSLNSDLIDQFSQDAREAGYENDEDKIFRQNNGSFRTLIFPKIENSEKFIRFCRAWKNKT